MIVRNAGAALHLITQPDHAALARRVMEHWPGLTSHPRREAVLLAVEEHDNGWRESDGAPLADPESGRIYDFINLPGDLRRGVWPRGVARLADRERWAAALVAHHAVTVYDRYRSDPEWHAFFDEMETLRDEHRAAAGQPHAALLDDYQYVRIGDLISLVFCNRWLEPQTFGNWTFRLEGEAVTVAPDPFAGRDILVTIEALEIPDVRYESDAALQQACASAPTITLRGVVRGGTQDSR